MLLYIPRISRMEVSFDTPYLYDDRSSGARNSLSVFSYLFCSLFCPGFLPFSHAFSRHCSQRELRRTLSSVWARGRRGTGAGRENAHRPPHNHLPFPHCCNHVLLIGIVPYWKLKVRSNAAHTRQDTLNRFRFYPEDRAILQRVTELCCST